MIAARRWRAAQAEAARDRLTAAQAASTAPGATAAPPPDNPSGETSAGLWAWLRRIVRAVTFAVAWFVAHVVLSLPALLLDAWSGLRLQYRPGPYNLFTLTLALTAIPAVFLAWQLPRWLRL